MGTLLASDANLKIGEMRRLAITLREYAKQAALNTYAEVMARAASDLEERAARLCSESN